MSPESSHASGRQTEQQYRSFVIDFNNSSAAYPADKTIVELFAIQAALTPEAEAIRFGDQSLRYRELNERANQVAAHLRTLGIAPARLVVLFMEHSIEIVCAILGVLKTGAAYVPLDPATPKDRLAFILQDIAEGLGGAPVLMTQERLSSGLPVGAARLVTLDADFASILGYPVSPPPYVGSSRDLAYIIYTSGSTGTPKGVMIENRSLVNYIWWANQQYCRGERLNWPLFSSMAFDLTVTSIFTPLISGGRIVVYREDPLMRATAVLKIVEDNAVDIVKLTPAHLAMIRDMNLGSSRIRKFIVGGEEFKTELARDITGRFSHSIEIYNEYGPTEATVGCMIHRYDLEKDVSLAVPIGIPAPNAAIYLLDEQCNPVPTGVIGEMYLAGDGLARGYFNRAELTEQKFLTINDPRHSGAHGRSSSGAAPDTLRTFKTGDIARWSTDGRMEFLGRRDHQVKVGGARIELGEIETRLLKHSDVRDCVATVFSAAPPKSASKELTHADKAQAYFKTPDELKVRLGQRAAQIGYEEPQQSEKSGITRLAAFYVSDKELTVAELRVHLANELPDYMIPTFFIRLDKLPLTANGKIDRRALPAPSAENVQAAHEFVGPRTPTEAKVAAIFAELLQVTPVGAHANFFDLGGHSLSAIRLMSRLQTTFKVDLPLQVLFETPTVAGLSDKLCDLTGAPRAGTSSVEAGSSPRRGPRSATERRLVEIWERVLDTAPIGIDESFLQLQGPQNRLDSMLAEVKRAFGYFAQGFPVSEFVAEPTIEALARIIDAAVKPPSTLAVCLQPRGSKRPVFLFHAGGGYVFFYRALASRLGPERPVYGVRAATKSDRQSPSFERNKSVEALAACYIAEIKRIQPRGPYTLGGACFGGVIAFEMARQLQAAGEEIAGPLLLFDAFLRDPAGYAQFGGLGLGYAINRVFVHLDRSSRLGSVEAVGYLLRKAMTNLPVLFSLPPAVCRRVWRQLKLSDAGLEISRMIATARSTPMQLEQVQRRTVELYLDASLRMLMKYRPGVFEGKIVLFKAENGPSLEPEWVGLARGGMVVHETRGVHLDMMEEPAVIETSALVARHLSALKD